MFLVIKLNNDAKIMLNLLLFVMLTDISQKERSFVGIKNGKLATKKRSSLYHCYPC